VKALCRLATEGSGRFFAPSFFAERVVSQRSATRGEKRWSREHIGTLEQLIDSLDE
jgi:hypothetical protein